MSNGKREGGPLRASSALGAMTERLSRVEGVVGVFWGRPLRGGAWQNESSIVVHVKKRRELRDLDEHQRIPEHIGRFRTDVLEVGDIRAQALDCYDPVVAGPDRHPRTSAVTCLGVGGGRVFALLSGHGVLPIVNGQIVRDYTEGNGPSVFAEIKDRWGSPGSAIVLRGSCAGRDSLDWAIAELQPGVEIDLSHPVPRDIPSIAARSPAEYSTVVHYSRRFDALRWGRLKQTAVHPTSVAYDDGTVRPFPHLLVVDGARGVFSRSGDSGSLVFNAECEAIGILIAASESSGLSYVLPIPYLLDALSSESGFFFSSIPDLDLGTRRLRGLLSFRGGGSKHELLARAPAPGRRPVRRSRRRKRRGERRKILVST